MQFCRPNTSSINNRNAATSLSSIDTKIAPSSRKNCFNSIKRGYIMHSQRSCRSSVSPSLPTTSPNQRRISGEFTLSL